MSQIIKIITGGANMKNLLTGSLVLILSLVLVGCGGDSSDSTSIKLGHVQTEDSPWQDGAEKFKKEVEDNSDGEIEVEIYPNSNLGGDTDLAEGMQAGSIDASLIAGVLGDFEPSIQILNFPYLFDNEEEFDRIVHGDIGDEIADRLLESSDIRILDYWSRGPRQLTTNEPVESIDDIQGLKVRLPEIKSMESAWQEMGASPTTMAWDEVYSALQQGTIDAQENPIPFSFSSNIQEVQDYVAITDHVYEFATLSFSEDTWDSLDSEQQKIVEEASEKATESYNDSVEETTEKNLEEMEDEGMEVTHPDTKEMKEKSMDSNEKVAKEIDEDLYQEILDELDK